jgi:hypothetical protein
VAREITLFGEEEAIAVEMKGVCKHDPGDWFLAWRASLPKAQRQRIFDEIASYSK